MANKEMTHKFLALLYSSDGWNMEEHARLFRTKGQAKEWVEKTAERQYKLSKKHEERFNEEVQKVQNNKKKLRQTLRELNAARPWTVQNADVFEMFQSGSLKLRAGFDGTSSTGEDGGPWKGWK